jgi:DNA-binding HxlR family transcriptional regulator
MDTNGKTRHVDYQKPACTVEATLDLIGDKWKRTILFHLLGGRLRSGELSRRTGCVTQRMLTKQLRKLEATGL